LAKRGNCDYRRERKRDSDHDGRKVSAEIIHILILTAQQ